MKAAQNNIDISKFLFVIGNEPVYVQVVVRGVLVNGVTYAIIVNTVQALSLFIISRLQVT